MGYFHNTLVAFDCWANTLRGGLPGVTISSDAGRARDRGETWGVVLSGFLDMLQRDHVDKAVVSDAARADDVKRYLATNPGATIKEALAAVPAPIVTTAVLATVKAALPDKPLTEISTATVADVYSKLFRNNMEQA